MSLDDGYDFTSIRILNYETKEDVTSIVHFQNMSFTMPSYNVELVYDVIPKSYTIYSHYLFDNVEKNTDLKGIQYLFQQNIHLELEQKGYSLYSLKIVHHETKEEVTRMVDYKNGNFVMPNYDVDIFYQYHKTDEKFSDDQVSNASQNEIVENPDTGSELPITSLLILFFVSILGFVISKKRFYRL